MSPLIDTHCHLTHGRLRQRTDDVLARAASAGVDKIICAAADLEESRSALKLADSHDHLYCTAGVHPHDAKDVPADYLATIEELAGGSSNVAIGEIGLDYHYDFSPRDAQRRIFAEQLALTGRVAKPVVIHTREAFDDTFAILAESGFDCSRLVFHSFTGDASQARTIIDMGAMISFSGIVTFSRAGDLRTAAKLVPDDRLLVETDAPFLSPEPVRKMKTNEPANVAHVAACLAKLRGVSEAELAELTSDNAVRFFGLDS